MVSASRSFGFVLKAIGSHAPRRAHSTAAAAAAAAMPSSSSRSLPLNAALLRHAALRRKAAAGGARCLSTESAAAAPPRARGSTLFQRLSSFLAGVGVTSLIGFYFLYQDVKRSTDLVKASLGDITRRLDALEK